MVGDIVAYGHNCRRQVLHLVLTKEEPDTLALTLLAAANHTEKP